MYFAMSWISGSYSRGIVTTDAPLVLLTAGVVAKVAMAGSCLLSEKSCGLRGAVCKRYPRLKQLIVLKMRDAPRFKVLGRVIS